MLTIHACRAPYIQPAFLNELKAARKDTEQTHYIIVPRLLTLQTERLLMKELKLEGSFTLQVCTPSRFCMRIFNAAGIPEGTRIDELGRVMLARDAALKLEDRLRHFNRAVRQRGFAVKCAEQLARFRQAGLTPGVLEACASNSGGMLAEKLADLAIIQRAYEQRLAGRYQDGESEFMLAIDRVPKAEFLKDCRVWFYGFDVMPGDLMRLAVTVASVCAETHLFIPADLSDSAPDSDCFNPLTKGIERLEEHCKKTKVPVRRKKHLPPKSERQDTLSFLARSLYALPAPAKAEAEPGKLRLMRFRSVTEECAYIAACCRYMAQQKGMRWRDMHILVRDISSYREPLRTAFRAYEIPLFVSENRPAANYPLCECLLSALAVADGSASITNILAMMRSGYMPILDSDIHRLANYAESYKLRAFAFMQPFTCGKPEELEALEPVRAGLMAPVAELRSRLRSADDLRGQMTAVFRFLEDIGAEKRLSSHIHLLEDNDMRQEAGEESQTWDFIVRAADQMVALMGSDRLSIRDLYHSLQDSLSAIVVKPLPQSDDAVCAQGSNSMLTQEARLLILAGETDSAAEKPDGLLDTQQKQQLNRFADTYLGPDESELTRMRRFRLKHALMQVTDALLVTMSQTDATGSAQLPSPLYQDIENLFTNVSTSPVLFRDEETERVLRSAPAAALSLAARGLGETRGNVPLSAQDAAAISALARKDKWQPALDSVRMALNRGGSLQRLDPQTARTLYEDLKHQSITSLESFAGCPFKYFVKYGLRPALIKHIPLDNADEGSFLHEVMRGFLNETGDSLAALSRESAHEMMNRLCDEALKLMADKHILGSTPLDQSAAARLRQTALNCADLVTAHMHDSGFRVDSLEKPFGRNDVHPLEVEGCLLEGRIDRTDRCEDQHAVRVIDLKRSKHDLDLWEVYYGLNLQLSVYAAYVTRQDNSKNAGMYYMRLGDGIVADASRLAEKIEQARLKDLRLTGIAPADEALEAAMSPDFKALFDDRKSMPRAEQSDFKAICDLALRRIGEDIRAIREGRADVSPMLYRKSDPCTYCDFKSLCMHDRQLDMNIVRRRSKRGDNNAALQAILEEDN